MFQAFHNVSAGEKKNYVFWTSMHNKKLKVFLCTLCTFSILVQQGCQFGFFEAIF